MRRMTVVDSYDRMGGKVYYREDKYQHDPELREAYECGKREGWRSAMREAKHEHSLYAERHYPEHGGHILYREEHPMHHEPPMYRDGWRMPEDDEIVYRRRRDSRGRYM